MQEVYDDGTYTRQVTTLRGDGLTISEKFVQLLLGVKSFVDVVFVHTPTNRKWRGWVNSSDPGFRSLKFSCKRLVLKLVCLVHVHCLALLFANKLLMVLLFLWDLRLQQC